VIAHVGPLPVEETVPLLTSAGVGLLVARAWLMLQLRRRRGPARDGQQISRVPELED
jgi:hypothetical protein